MKYLIIILLLTSCSAGWHLKKAKQKGATIKPDTVYIDKPVYIPQVKTDTIFRSTSGDTVVIQKDRLRMRYVNLPGDTVFLEGECIADTITIKVPVTVTKNITVPNRLAWYDLLPWILLVIALIIILIRRA